MRKITSKHEGERKKKRNQWTIGVILILVMFFSVLGYAFSGKSDETTENSNKVIYNGYEFVNQNNFWVLRQGNFNFMFRYNPNQVEKSRAFVNPVSNYYQEPLYLYSESSEAETEIYINLGQFALRTQSACLEGEDCPNEDLPIKTCSDNFIIIREDTENAIVQEGNCVYIIGPQENLTKITDEFLFKILGIE